MGALGIWRNDMHAPHDKDSFYFVNTQNFGLCCKTYGKRPMA
jgi:hypothetical protein